MANNVKPQDKVVFVNGLNNNSSLSLSKQYPFAVFLSEYQDGNTKEGDIFMNGIRFTKFKGVDTSVITIGNHQISLVFNKQTGILSLKGVDSITSSNPVFIFYIDKNGNWQKVNINNSNASTILHTKNNKFYLVFEYNLSSNVNFNNVNKSLEFDNIYPNIQYNGEHYDKNSMLLPSEIYQTLNAANKNYHIFTFDICGDYLTVNNGDVPTTLSYNSIYSPSVSGELSLRPLYNPQTLNIKYENYELPYLITDDMFDDNNELSLTAFIDKANYHFGSNNRYLTIHVNQSTTGNVPFRIKRTSLGETYNGKLIKATYEYEPSSLSYLNSYWNNSCINSKRSSYEGDELYDIINELNTGDLIKIIQSSNDQHPNQTTFYIIGEKTNESGIDHNQRYIKYKILNISNEDNLTEPYNKYFTNDGKLDFKIIKNKTDYFKPNTSYEIVFKLSLYENTLINNSITNSSFNYPELDKTYKYVYDAVYSDNFIYVGYKDPDTLTVNDFISLPSNYNENNIIFNQRDGETGLLNTEILQNLNSDNDDKYLYIVVPNTEKYKNIMPRFEFYILQDGNKVYVPQFGKNKYLFTREYSALSIPNIEFIIYKSVYPLKNNKFYGVIQ